MRRYSRHDFCYFFIFVHIQSWPHGGGHGAMTPKAQKRRTKMNFWKNDKMKNHKKYMFLKPYKSRNTLKTLEIIIAKRMQSMGQIAFMSAELWPKYLLTFFSKKRAPAAPLKFRQNLQHFPQNRSTNRQEETTPQGGPGPGGPRAPNLVCRGRV